MITTIYAVLGWYVYCASFNPKKYKFFLGMVAWVYSFAHGVIALLAVFTFNQACSWSPNPCLLWNGNYDKLFLAVPTWFGTFLLHAYFGQACWGSWLLPWSD